MLSIYQRCNSESQSIIKRRKRMYTQTIPKPTFSFKPMESFSLYIPEPKVQMTKTPSEKDIQKDMTTTLTKNMSQKDLTSTFIKNNQNNQNNNPMTNTLSKSQGIPKDMTNTFTKTQPTTQTQNNQTQNNQTQTQNNQTQTQNDQTQNNQTQTQNNTQTNQNILTTDNLPPEDKGGLFRNRGRGSIRILGRARNESSLNNNN